MKNNKGFTLIEFLIYATVLSITAGMLVGILTNTLRIRSREAGNTEVAQQLSFVTNTIQSLVNDASLIDSVYETGNEAGGCTAAVNYCTLKLRFSSNTLDPTWIIASSTGIYIKRDAESPLTSADLLTNSDVIVDRLKFTKYVFAGGHDSVKIEIALTYNTDKPQLVVSRTLISVYGRAMAVTFDETLQPGTGSTYDVGQSGTRWKDGWFSGNVSVAGTLGVGTATAPVDTLQVVGDARVGTGTTGCLKDADGTTLTGTCSSDKRLKENIAPLGSILDKYALLNPVSFNWRYKEYPELNLGQEIQYGLVAQEVEKLFPELVTENENGFKQLRFNYLPIYNIQAIKEQQEQINFLKEKLSELTGEELDLNTLKSSARGDNSQKQTQALFGAGLFGGLLSASLILLLLKRK